MQVCHCFLPALAETASVAPEPEPERQSLSSTAAARTLASIAGIAPLLQFLAALDAFLELEGGNSEFESQFLALVLAGLTGEFFLQLFLLRALLLPQELLFLLLLLLRILFHLYLHSPQ